MAANQGRQTSMGEFKITVNAAVLGFQIVQARFSLLFLLCK